LSKGGGGLLEKEKDLRQRRLKKAACPQDASDDGSVQEGQEESFMKQGEPKTPVISKRIIRSRKIKRMLKLAYTRRRKKTNKGLYGDQERRS